MDPKLKQAFFTGGDAGQADDQDQDMQM